MTNNLIPYSPRITEEEARRTIESMNLIDGFLFDSVIENPDDARMVIGKILKTVFGREFADIIVTGQKTFQGIDRGYHGIRLDAHVFEDSAGELTATIYDVEVENRPSDKRDLPRRMRYYEAMVDDKLLSSMTDYLSLPDFISIIILSYDPFGADEMYYEVRSSILNHPDIPYDDGIKHIFLYCNGKMDDHFREKRGKHLAELLKYFISGQLPDTENSDITIINEIVNRVKRRKEVTGRYMQQWDRENQIRRETQYEDARSFILFGQEIGVSKETIIDNLKSKMNLKDSLIHDLFNDMETSLKD